jgi:N-methylhydantoinase B
MPRGEVTVETRHDPFPGVPDGVGLRVTLRVDPTAGTIEVDLRDNPDCVPCGLNLTEATSKTAAMVGVLNSLPETVPVNAGTYRRLRVRVRSNCVAGVPRHPASCSLATTGIADRVANAVQRAASELGPGIGMAEAGLCTPPASGVVSGRDPRRDGKPFLNQLILGMTGGAGGPSADGWLNVAHVGNAGLMLRDSTEVDELRHPVRIWTDAIVPDSEGAGAHRGAPSAKVEFGPVNCAMDVMWASDGNVHPACGARGGQRGAPARQFKRERSGSLVELPSTGRATLVDPETIVSFSCGGGCYGEPSARESDAVAGDVSEGWITPRRARDVYRVVVDFEGNVDREATDRLRQSAGPLGNDPGSSEGK